MSTKALKKQEKTAKPRSGKETQNYKIVSVRLRSGEYDELQKQASKLGLSNNLALRIAARKISGFLEVDDVTQDELREITSNLDDISKGLNQLDKSVREGEHPQLKELTKVRREFGHQFVELDKKLQVIMSVAKRRNDGRKRLKNAARKTQKTNSAS